jgi:hypothetical protein
MRRIAVVIGTVIAAVAISSPAYAFAHDRVANPWWHAILDVLTLAIVSAPLWTAFAWRTGRRRSLLALIAVIQLPVAVFAFVPIADPVLHAIALGLGLTITVSAVWYVRHAAQPAKDVATQQLTVH